MGELVKTSDSSLVATRFNRDTGVLSGEGTSASIVESELVVKSALDSGSFSCDETSVLVIIDEAAAVNYPLTGAIIYSREWAEDSANGEQWRTEMADLDAVVVDLFPNGDWDSGNPSGLSRNAATVDLLNKSGGRLRIYEYIKFMEVDASQAVEQDLVDWLYETSAFLIAPPWTTGPDDVQNYPPSQAVNDHWGREPDGDIDSTFGGQGSTIFNTNITDYPDIYDAQGRGYPEFYADRTSAIKFAVLSVPKDGGPGSVGGFVDVMNQNMKTNGQDPNGDGVAERGRSGWRDPAYPTGIEAAQKFRAGQRRGIDRFRTYDPNIGMMGNWTTHTYRIFDDELDAAGYWVGTDMSKLPYIYPEYYLQCNAALIENLNNGNFPESGVKADGTQAGSGSWRRMYNMYVQAMLTTDAPNLVFVDTKADLTPHQSQDPNFFVPTGGPFHVMRRGLCTTLLDNGVFMPHFNQSTFRTIAWIDELGLRNTGTTGLSRGWLGPPIDPPQRAPVFGTIWARRFLNGGVIVDEQDNYSGSTTLIHLANDLGWTEDYETFLGVQDPVANDGQAKTTITLNQADGRVLRRVGA